MKYESTILKRLIDTYGVVGNPRYISEIIKEFIVRGKERFPELFTYQADWLAHIDEFGLNPSYTVSYTGQSIYAPNTLERPVKSAILKGNTLVNMLSISNTSISNNTGVEYKYNITPTIGKTYLIKLKINSIGETSSAHPVKIELFSSTDSKGYFDITSSNYVVGNEIIKTITAIDGNRLQSNSIVIWCRDLTSGIFDVDITMLEYQNGMENWDIPYFEGMQSVKMPGLTTTGKNLFDYSSHPITLEKLAYADGQQVYWTGYIGVKTYVPVKENTTYTYSNDINVGIRFGLVFYDDDKSVLSYINNFKTNSFTSFTTPKGCKFIRFAMETQTIPQWIQLEEDTSPTSYEPYKSNILTVNEDVTLRGIGDVKDTLDCLTGELTQRIVQKVLNGSEAWYLSQNPTDNLYFRLNVSDILNQETNVNIPLVLSDKYPGKTQDSVVNKHQDGICSQWSGQQLVVKDSTVSTIDEFKAKLSQSPMTVSYIMDTPTIKTVDLAILDQNGQNVKQLMSFNGGTHFNTRSSEGSTQPSVSVSVETDLEETLKMCSLDGNTM